MPDLLERFTHQVQAKVLPRVRAEYRANIEALADFNAIRYSEGGHFAVHRDNTAGFERRLFTVVCYLNDDIRGGETRFPDLNLAVRPQAGVAITFPSEYRHASLPVIAGVKYVLVCWLVGPPPPKWI
ncbi:2OG-Fe(II) oxygenase [Chitinimonas naiadis]